VTLATFSRARDISADVGWLAVLRVAPQWLVCRRYLGLSADLDDAVLERPQRPEVRVAPLDSRDVVALSAVDHTLTREEVIRRLDEGQQCTLGWWGHELAHVRWDSTAAAYLPYLGLSLRPGCADQVVVGIYTKPAFRGHGVAGAVMMEAARRARAAGVTRLVWVAAWWNTRSLALARQTASRIEGTVGYWTLGPWRRYFASGGIRIAQDASFSIDRRLAAARSTPRDSCAKRQC